MAKHVVRQIPALRLLSDAHLHPQKHLRAKVRDDAFDPVVSACASLCPDAQLTRRKADVVVDHDQLLLRIDLEKVACCAQAFTA